jgi:ABC-type Na+ transport system ATPase subunit NatA
MSSIVLEYDSNWIVLAHRFYGLQSDDSTLTKLIHENGAGLTTMLKVPKNSLIKYYV